MLSALIKNQQILFRARAASLTNSPEMLSEAWSSSSHLMRSFAAARMVCGSWPMARTKTVTGTIRIRPKGDLIHQLLGDV